MRNAAQQMRQQRRHFGPEMNLAISAILHASGLLATTPAMSWPGAATSGDSQEACRRGDFQRLIGHELFGI